jgi:hypothetical protein
MPAADIILSRITSRCAPVRPALKTGNAGANLLRSAALRNFNVAAFTGTLFAILTTDVASGAFRARRRNPTAKKINTTGVSHERDRSYQTRICLLDAGFTGNDLPHAIRGRAIV